MASLAEFQAFQQRYGAAFQQLRATLLGLDGSRVFNLLEECRLHQGRLTRERAFLTFHHWRDGHDAVADEATLCLFTFLPRHLTRDEKLALLKCLRHEVLEHLPRQTVALTVARGGDLSAVAGEVTRLMRRVEGMELPADFLAVQRWLTQEDMRALHALVRETEHFIAAHRLSDLMVQLATLSRLAVLASARSAIRVRTQFDVPTATVAIRFDPAFWREQGRAAAPDLLVRVQEIALRPEAPACAGLYLDRVMQALTTADWETLRALAAREGLYLETLLHELQIKTLAAQSDIRALIATAERLRALHVQGKMTSEHAHAAGTTHIAIRPMAGLGDALAACCERLDHLPVVARLQALAGRWAK